MLLLLLLIMESQAQLRNDYVEEIPGEAGVDYPTLASVPDTDFSCENRVSGGYYADTQTNCQVFHICMDSGSTYYGLIKYSFVCPNGTMFHQQYFICDWWYNVDCGASQDFYDLNNNLFKDFPQQQHSKIQQASTSGPEQDLPSYGGSPRRNPGRQGKGKGNPVRISINNEAEYLPFPNFPSPIKNQSQRKSRNQYGNRRIRFPVERFPRDYDGEKHFDEDDNEDEDEENDFDYIDYSNKPSLE